MTLCLKNQKENKGFLMINCKYDKDRNQNYLQAFFAIIFKKAKNFPTCLNFQNILTLIYRTEKPGINRAVLNKIMLSIESYINCLLASFFNKFFRRDTK